MSDLDRPVPALDSTADSAPPLSQCNKMQPNATSQKKIANPPTHLNPPTLVAGLQPLQSRPCRFRSLLCRFGVGFRPLLRPVFSHKPSRRNHLAAFAPSNLFFPQPLPLHRRNLLPAPRPRRCTQKHTHGGITMTRMMTCSLALVALLLATLAAKAEAPKLETSAWLNLWDGKAPGALGESPEDTPAVQVFLPPTEKATGSSIVVCPGGGYGGRAAHEAGVVGEWLARNGVAGFVLRYRVGPKGYHHPIEMGDASRAVRFVRAHAADWNLDPKRIGILGFSAGGHLASTIATHWDEGKADAADPIDRASSRPDVQILIYPVI